MTFLQSFSIFAALAVVGVSAQSSGSLPPVDPEALEDAIKLDALLGHEQALEDFAYSYPERNRLIGTQAHNDTVTYLYDTLSALGGYYDVQLQPFTVPVQLEGEAAFSTNNVSQDAEVFEYSPSGNVTAPLVLVDNLGCNATDYPAEVAGNIALISRGGCDFGLKVALAGATNASGAVIYNNAPGNLSGTLQPPPRPEGPYVPAVGISQENGTALVAALGSGTEVIGDLDVYTVIENTSSYNVIAQSLSGDQNNVLALGAHTDSVEAGPGINDDGSGIAGILEVAIQLANYSVKNSVRFGFWSGEEGGLLGSTYYVENLSEEELAKIRLYLNFDMIASPNYVYAIYDGDGSSFNLSGPQGSAEVEALYQEFFADRGQNFTAYPFDGRSDYGPFLDAGIACGGLFTGAEEIKTGEQVEAFGGEAGVALDHCYHQACDNMTNLNGEAFLINAQAIAYSVATYATSFDSLGQNATVTKRDLGQPSIVKKHNQGNKKKQRVKRQPAWVKELGKRDALGKRKMKLRYPRSLMGVKRK